MAALKALPMRRVTHDKSSPFTHVQRVMDALGKLQTPEYATTLVNNIKKMRAQGVLLEREIAALAKTLDQKLQVTAAGVDSFAESISKANTAIRNFILSLPAGTLKPAPEAPAKAKGKITGGYTRGLDTIQRSLSPGELVMNPSASNQFYGQLQAMNAGVHRADAPNTNITGNWNISVNSTGDTSTDIQSIAKGLRRELRRKRVSLS